MKKRNSRGSKLSGEAEDLCPDGGDAGGEDGARSSFRRERFGVSNEVAEIQREKEREDNWMGMNASERMGVPERSVEEGRGIPNINLPERLFAADHYPDKARLNIYSRPENLGALADILRGSNEWDRIMKSQFGKLFRLPVARCSHSGKLIHGLLARQLVTKKKHELWCVYGGFPLRFSLREFHITTGLRCGQFPSAEDIEAHKDASYLSVWNRLFGEKTEVTVVDVLEMLRDDKLVEEGNRKKFSSWKKTCLALIVIVDGVVVCNNREGLVTEEYVEMLHNVEFFLSYPWGRVAFKETLRRFGPERKKLKKIKKMKKVQKQKEDDPIGELKKRLKQSSSCCYGFPLGLQIQALNAIPAILGKMKEKDDIRDFTERGCEGLSNNTILRESDVLDAEDDEKLSVAHTVMPDGEMDESDLGWADEVEDAKVDCILKMVEEGHIFKQWEWPGGDSTLPSLREAKSKGKGQRLEHQILDGEDEGDVPNLTKVKSKKVGNQEVGRKPLTRSSSKKTKDVDTPVKQSSRQQGTMPEIDRTEESSAPVTRGDMRLLMKWIERQNKQLREKIREDVGKIVGGKVDERSGTKSNIRRSKRTRVIGGGKTGKAAAMVGKKCTTRKGKRKRVEQEVESLSSGTSGGESFGGKKWSRSPSVSVRSGFREDEETLMDMWEQNPSMRAEVDRSVEKTSPARVNENETGGEDIRGEAINSTREKTSIGEGEKMDIDAVQMDIDAVPETEELETQRAENEKAEGEEAGGYTKQMDFEVGEKEASKSGLCGEDLESIQKCSDGDIYSTPPVRCSDTVSENTEAKECAGDKDSDKTIKEMGNKKMPTGKEPATPVPEVQHLDIGKRVPRRSHYLDDDEYAGDPRLKALFASRVKKPVYSPIPELNEAEFKTFMDVLEEDKEMSYTILTGHTLSNSDFIDIATKGKWISTDHMQVIMALVWRRRGHEYASGRSAVIDPWFISLLSTHYAEFEKCGEKDKYNWGSSIQKYVGGKSTGRLLRTKFVKDVDVVYVPMNWGESHWVGLVINFQRRHVEILDPFLVATNDDVVANLLAPVTEMIPWVVKRFIGQDLGRELRTDPYTWYVAQGIFGNNCDADCGPVAAKLLEMKAHGLSPEDMCAMDDDMVALLRKAYAMDAYLAFVEPF